MKNLQYSFLTEIQSLTPTRNAESEVGDPIGGVDQQTEKTRREAKSIKAQSELLAAKAQFEKTKHDAAKLKQQIRSEKEEEANQKADRERQLQMQQQQQQQSAVQPQDPTMDPNATM